MERLRKNLRKRGYDYTSPGYYFLTICSHFRNRILSTINEYGSQASLYGRIVETCWNRLPAAFESIRLDAFMVMPDHLHGIIQLMDSNRYSLSTVVQNFKSVSTCRINNVRKTPGRYVWQRNYYERIIRTDRELNLIRLYIKLNPVLWLRNVELADLEYSEEKLTELLKDFVQE